MPRRVAEKVDFSAAVLGVVDVVEGQGGILP